MSENITSKLTVFEGKVVRKIFGPNCVSGVWRIKYNELYSLYKEPSVLKNG
jgi:hypothetical protein